MSTKYALLIGINHYLFQAQRYQLEGCVNDVFLLKRLLINKFNFLPQNITTLCDAQATRAAIIYNMQLLAEKIDHNDIVVFHFSGHGHGCRVKTEFTDEGSGKINSIIPCDDAEPAEIDPEIAPEGEIWREIREHEIAQWLAKLADKTPYTTLIFDACHSGTITRSNQKTSVRALPDAVRHRASDNNRGSNSTAEPSTVDSNWLTRSKNYVVISGCRDTQKAKEIFFTEGSQRFKHGVLTYSLCSALQQANSATTYRDIFEQVHNSVVGLIDLQNPQIEGDIDRQVFGIEQIEPLPFIPISAIDLSNATVTLDGGAAQGLRIDSQWRVFPPFTKKLDTQLQLGVVQVTQVGSFSSTAVIVHGKDKMVNGARCVNIETHGVAKPLTIALDEVSNQHSLGLISRIKRSSCLSLIESSSTADVYARIVNHRDELPVDSVAMLSASLSFPAWAFFQTPDVLAMPPHGINERGVEGLLLDNLEKIARYRNTLQLNNPVSQLKVEFNLYQRQANDDLILANGANTTFIENTSGIVLEFKNTHSEQTVFFNLLWLSANKEVSQVYPPNRHSEELSAGNTVRIGLGEQRLTASLAADYFADTGMDTCKVFFSNKETDFRWLNQQGVRNSTQAGSGIEAVDLALRTERVNSSEASHPKVDDWVAINRSFLIKRKRP